MKKTLLLTIDFPPQSGGVARYLAGLGTNLPHQELVVLAPRVKKNLDNQFKFRIYRRNLFWPIWPQWLPMIRHLYKIIKKEKIKMLWAAQPLPVGTAVYLISKFLKLPYIVNTHGMDVALILKAGNRKLKIGKRILQSAKAVTVNSEYTKGLVLKLGVAEDKVIKVYPCPEIKSQKLKVKSQEVIKKYNLEDKKVLLTIGRLVKRKGQDQVIRALAKVLEKVPNLVYLIGGDGENKENLLKLIKQLNLEKKVILTGFIPDQELAAYYQATDAFIMVSSNLQGQDMEGFGLVYLEANSLAKPVISGSQGGEAEAVIDNQTGLMVDSENIEEIAQAIIKLMTDEELAKQLGEAGKKRIEEKFKWENEARKIEGLLR